MEYLPSWIKFLWEIKNYHVFIYVVYTIQILRSMIKYVDKIEMWLKCDVNIMTKQVEALIDSVMNHHRHIYRTELQLNKANTSNIEIPFKI